jgi:hypothetical protein
MDALAHVASVAQPLLHDVDSALATLGAPPSHPVWRHLRSLRATPAQAVTFFVELEPPRLRMAATSLRDEAQSYERATIPAAAAWEGVAAQHYATTAAAVIDHLSADGIDSMVGRLRALASALDAVADWQQHSRDALAGVLAGVLMSRQAMTVRSHRALGGPAQAVWQAATDGLPEAVLAAADIGAALLAAAEEAQVAGQRLLVTLDGLHELRYQPPAASDPIGHSGTIRLS